MYGPNSPIICMALYCNLAVTAWLSYKFQVLLYNINRTLKNLDSNIVISIINLFIHQIHLLNVKK